MTKPHTILGVFAHPDDESFGPGGTLARYAAQGAEVHVIIATDGIAGSVEEGFTTSHSTLAQERSIELSDAAVELGVTTIWSLPYRDSGMRGSEGNAHPECLVQQPMDRLVTDLRDYMLRLQPDVVITHDPFGGYGHPDHVCCCEATTAAFFLLNEKGTGQNGAAGSNGYHPQKLYYTAFDKRWLKVMVQVMKWRGQDPTAVGRNKDINLEEIAGWETPVHARIDVLPYLPRKEAASRAHVSQYGGGPSFIRSLPGFIRNRFLGNETFTRAYPEPATNVELDLLAGVR